MRDFVKRIASKLPKRMQQQLKRRYFSYQIKKNTFVTDELEFSRLSQWVGEDDWVIDVGANIGHYTKRLSELVGRGGRVVAFEPIQDTFELLAANSALFKNNNITLINACASESTQVLGMQIPQFDTGLCNYYMAHLTEDSDADLQVLCFSIDSMFSTQPIKLVKIDAEGHDLSVLKGMDRVLRDSRPVLIIEDDLPEIERYLKDFGYESERLDGSHNKIFTSVQG